MTDGLDGEDLARTKAFIAQVNQRFTVAKSVPDAPHQYIARAWLNAEQQREFDWLVDLIGRVGYMGRFWNATWRYIDLGPHKYWASRSWYGEDAGKPRTMLNRTRLDHGHLGLDPEGQQ
jgi:hypothetical protein